MPLPGKNRTAEDRTQVAGFVAVQNAKIGDPHLAPLVHGRHSAVSQWQRETAMPQIRLDLAILLSLACACEPFFAVLRASTLPNRVCVCVPLQHNHKQMSALVKKLRGDVDKIVLGRCCVQSGRACSATRSSSMRSRRCCRRRVPCPSPKQCCVLLVPFPAKAAEKRHGSGTRHEASCCLATASTVCWIPGTTAKACTVAIAVAAVCTTADQLR